ncbi:type II and III secretion system protein family protein [Shewanella gaetbuli]
MTVFISMYRMILMAVLLLVPMAALAHAHSNIELYVGEVKTLDVGQVKRIAVGLDSLLATKMLDNGELLLIPKAPGETQLHIWKSGNKQFTFTINVLSTDTAKYLQRLRSIFRSFRNITFRNENDMVIVEGKIRPEDEELFNARIATFANVMSFVRAEHIELKDMIKIDVKVLELNKTNNLQFGINWDNAIQGPSVALVNNFKPNDFFVFSAENNPLLRLFDDGGIPVSSSSSHTYAGMMSGINSVINLLKEDGDARILAEPSLSTRSGQQASFHSGGEYPIAILNEYGQPVIEMQDYGIQLEIEPVTDEHGNIISKIRAEMSSLDFSTVVNGVPGILTRNTESVVNLKAGETLVISGLLKAEDSEAYEKIPFLGEIPILGELFTSRNFKEGRSELVILVTPSIQTAITELPDSLDKTISDLKNLGNIKPMSAQLID